MSDMFSLQTRDFIKGLIVFVFGAVLTVILQMLQSGFSNIDYKQIILIATTSAISYLLKNLFSDNQGKFLGRV